MGKRRRERNELNALHPKLRRGQNKSFSATHFPSVPLNNKSLPSNLKLYRPCTFIKVYTQGTSSLSKNGQFPCLEEELRREATSPTCCPFFRNGSPPPSWAHPIPNGHFQAAQMAVFGAHACSNAAKAGGGGGEERERHHRHNLRESVIVLSSSSSCVRPAQEECKKKRDGGGE